MNMLLCLVWLEPRKTASLHLIQHHFSICLSSPTATFIYGGDFKIFTDFAFDFAFVNPLLFIFIISLFWFCQVRMDESPDQISLQVKIKSLMTSSHSF